MQYMEGGNLYNAFNFAAGRFRVPPSGPPNCPQNLTVIQIKNSTYMCPSDPDPNQTVSNSLGTAAVSICSYRYNVGATICESTKWTDGGDTQDPWTSNCLADVNGPRGGLFFEEGVRSIGAVSDGTSNTAAFAERPIGSLQSAGTPGRYDVLKAASGSPADRAPTITTDILYSACRANNNIGGVFDRFDGFYGIDTGAILYSSWQVTMYNHLFPPNGGGTLRDCNTGQSYIDSPNESSTVSAGSRHPGGANILLTDGSARFIKSTVAQNVWQGLGTIRGGEVLSADAY